MRLDKISQEIRKTIIELANKSKSPHVGSSLSCVDILTALYFDVLNLQPWEKRDIFILSKAHAAMSLYSTLATRGIIDKNLLMAIIKMKEHFRHISIDSRQKGWRYQPDRWDTGLM